MINNIVLVPNPNKDIGLSITKELVSELKKLKFSLFAESGIAEQLAVNSYVKLPDCADLIIVIGGDGSVIDASVIALEHDIPIVGINLGKVGYLTEVYPDNLSIFKNVMSGEYFIDEKMLLEVTVTGENKRLQCERYAVNDVVIAHDTFLGIRKFKIENKLGDVGGSKEYPTTFAPKKRSASHIHAPLNPVFPVTKTFLFL